MPPRPVWRRRSAGRDDRLARLAHDQHAVGWTLSAPRTPGRRCRKRSSTRWRPRANRCRTRGASPPPRRARRAPILGYEGASIATPVDVLSSESNGSSRSIRPGGYDVRSEHAPGGLLRYRERVVVHTRHGDARADGDRAAVRQQQDRDRDRRPGAAAAGRNRPEGGEGLFVGREHRAADRAPSGVGGDSPYRLGGESRPRLGEEAEGRFRNRVASRSACASAVNMAVTLARPSDARRAAASGGPASTQWIADARLAGSPGGTRRPEVPSTTTCLVPLTSVAMTGRPLAIASTSASGSPSQRHPRTIQHPELDHRAIRRPPHDATHRIHFPHDGALRYPPDRGVARHLPDGLQILGDQERPCPAPRRCPGCFGAGVSPADNDDIVLVHGGETTGPNAGTGEPGPAPFPRSPDSQFPAGTAPAPLPLSSSAPSARPP